MDVTVPQARYIDYLASGQINNDGKRVSQEDFAASIGVDRRTLYRWQQAVPDFWTRVSLRADYYIHRDVPKILVAMKVKAIRGDVAAAKLLLAQAERLKPLQAAVRVVDDVANIDSALLE